MSNVSEAEWNLRVDLAAAFHLAVANNLHEGIANHSLRCCPLQALRIGLYRTAFCRAETLAGCDGQYLPPMIYGAVHRLKNKFSSDTFPQPQEE
jgi:hypothetical protein